VGECLHISGTLVRFVVRLARDGLTSLLRDGHDPCGDVVVLAECEKAAAIDEL
jgi:hypothetical protein